MDKLPCKKPFALMAPKMLEMMPMSDDKPKNTAGRLVSKAGSIKLLWLDKTTKSRQYFLYYRDFL